MKKSFILPTLLLAGFLSANSAQAMEVKISDGQINFYQDNVLGKNTDAAGMQTDRMPQQSMPTTGNSLMVRPMDGQLELRVQDKQANQDVTLKPVQETRMQRLDIEAPSQLRGETTPQTNNYMQQVREERQDRSEEMMQIRARVMNQEETMAIESRGSTARVQNGAEFSINAESNEITITTPSGNIHTLNHLPDQAIERISESKRIPASTLQEQALDIETGDDGNLKFKAAVTERRKFLGIFPREFEREYILDDQTGEIQEEIKANSVFETLLNRLSF